jgi:hypothetical protein
MFSLPRPRTSLRQQVQLFDRAVRRCQAPMPRRAEFGLDALQAVGHVFQRGVPVHGLPLAALLEHRLRQARSLFSAS